VAHTFFADVSKSLPDCVFGFSNTGRWGYTDVRLTLRRTENSVPRSTESIVRERGGEAADDTELPLATPKDDWQE
jgi:hypothetical protein